MSNAIYEVALSCAENLVSMYVANGRKPIVFDMDKYKELNLGSKRNGADAHPDLDLHAISIVKAAAERAAEERDERSTFIDALNDVLCMNFFIEKYDQVGMMTLVEIGQCDLYEQLGEANVYMLMEIPKAEACFQLAL